LIDINEFVEDGIETEIISKITEPDTLERSLISMRLPAFQVKTDSTLKTLLKNSEKFGSFFSSETEYSRIAKNPVKIDEVHQSVIQLLLGLSKKDNLQ